jgi:hypothetical protein
MTRESSVNRAASPRWIFLFLAGNLLVHLFVWYVWNAAGQVVSLQGTSDSTNALSITCMAGFDFWLCLAVLRSFPKGSPMRSTWLLMSAAAAAATLAGLAGQFFGSDWLLNPLTWTGRPSSTLMELIRLSAFIAGGPLRLAILAVAILPLLRTLRRFGFHGRPTSVEWTVPAIFCLFTICRFVETDAGLLTGQSLRFEDGVSLAGLPILCVLSFEAMILRKSIGRMGSGLIPKMWRALVYAILVSGAGEIVLWAIPHFWQAPPSVLATLVRLPIAAAFALVPACALSAQRRAGNSAGHQPEDVATGVPALAR